MPNPIGEFALEKGVELCLVFNGLWVFQLVFRQKLVVRQLRILIGFRQISRRKLLIRHLRNGLATRHLLLASKAGRQRPADTASSLFLVHHAFLYCRRTRGSARPPVRASVLARSRTRFLKGSG